MNNETKLPGRIRKSVTGFFSKLRGPLSAVAEWFSDTFLTRTVELWELTPEDWDRIRRKIEALDDMDADVWKEK